MPCLIAIVIGLLTVVTRLTGSLQSAWSLVQLVRCERGFTKQTFDSRTLLTTRQHGFAPAHRRCRGRSRRWTHIVRPTRVAKTSTKPSPAPLQKHSLDGCTMDMHPSNCHRQGAYRFVARYLVSIRVQNNTCSSIKSSCWRKYS